MSEDIQEIVNPLAVVTNEDARTSFIDKLKKLISEQKPDTSTDKGRKEIASFAYKIARSKTAIDEAAKKSTEDMRAQINAVNETRNIVRKEIDELQALARKPLTDWENAEKARQERVEAIKQSIDSAKRDAIVTGGAMAMKQAIEILQSLDLNTDFDQHESEIITNRRNIQIEECQALLEQIEQAERDALELEKLREEKRIREEKEVQERAEKKERELKERQERERQEQEEHDRLAAEKRAAEEKENHARREKQIAEQAAAAERERIQREADQRVKDAEEKARLAKEEADRKEKARIDEENRIAAEKLKRQQDIEHRSKIMTAAKEAIMKIGHDEEAAKNIIRAIVAGEIPNVVINF